MNKLNSKGSGLLKYIQSVIYRCGHVLILKLSSVFMTSNQVNLTCGVLIKMPNYVGVEVRVLVGKQEYLGRAQHYLGVQAYT